MRDHNGEQVSPEEVLDEQELAEYYNQKAIERGQRPPYPNARKEQ